MPQILGVDKVTKGVVVSFLQKKYNLSVSDSSIIIDAFLKTLTNMAQNGIVLKNFGKFTLQERLISKNIRNFTSSTMETKTLKIRKIYFKPSKNLKNKVF